MDLSSKLPSRWLPGWLAAGRWGCHERGWIGQDYQAGMSNRVLLMTMHSTAARVWVVSFLQACGASYCSAFSLQIDETPFPCRLPGQQPTNMAATCRNGVEGGSCTAMHLLPGLPACTCMLPRQNVAMSLYVCSSPPLSACSNAAVACAQEGTGSWCVAFPRDRDGRCCP